VNIPPPASSDSREALYPLIGLGVQLERLGKQLWHRTVPETDTGGLVEHTQALERTMLKELGKLLA
jgi:hypothetical protein